MGMYDIINQSIRNDKRGIILRPEDIEQYEDAKRIGDIRDNSVRSRAMRKMIDKYRETYAKASEATGIPPEAIAHVHWRETGGGTKNAMQLSKPRLARLPVHENIMAGAEELRAMLDSGKKNYPYISPELHNDLMYMGYNAGPGRQTEYGGAVPPFEPTIGYVVTGRVNTPKIAQYMSPYLAGRGAMPKPMPIPIPNEYSPIQIGPRKKVFTDMRLLEAGAARRK